MVSGIFLSLLFGFHLFIFSLFFLVLKLCSIQKKGKRTCGQHYSEGCRVPFTDQKKQGDSVFPLHPSISNN